MIRLAHPWLSEPIEFRENLSNILVIENTVAYQHFLFSLLRQTDGGKGPFTLSLDYSPLEFDQHCSVIWDFYHLNTSSRKLNQKLHLMLNSIMHDELVEETQSIKQEMEAYLNQLVSKSPLPVEYDSEDLELGLLKTARFNFSLVNERPIDDLIEYLTIYEQLLQNQCVVLIGMDQLFESRELHYFVQMTQYRKLNVLRIERTIPKTYSETENIVLFDSDLCEIC